MDLRRFLAVGIVVCTLASGCRFKGVEAFKTATTPQETYRPENSDWKGDRYAATGLADPTGGLKTTSSGTESRNGAASDPIDPTYNRPAYGSGQRRGEQNSQAFPGHGTTNAPAFQPGPNTGAAGLR